jgi:hypothetical protein
VFLGFPSHGPRWAISFRPDPFVQITARIESLPTAIGAWPERAQHGALRTRRPPCPSGDAQQARRDRATSAAGRWVCVLHPCPATAPDPHHKTPPEAPLVDRGGCIIGAVFGAGINYFRGSESVEKLAGIKLR